MASYGDDEQRGQAEKDAIYTEIRNQDDDRMADSPSPSRGRSGWGWVIHCGLNPSPP
jgi:hypothetical protein